jgi:hypothetical protein
MYQCMSQWNADIQHSLQNATACDLKCRLRKHCAHTRSRWRMQRDLLPGNLYLAEEISSARARKNL